MVSFSKHQRKDDVTQQYLRQFDADEGVLYVGRAQRQHWHDLPVGGGRLGHGQPLLFLLRGL